MVQLKQAIAASALLALSGAAPVEEKRFEPFTVNLVPKTGVKLTGYQQYAKSLAKYGGSADQINAIQAAGTGSVVATSQDGDEEYTAPVTIGGQSFTLDFDTGSSDLWVLGSATRASGHSLYAPAASKRLSGETWSIEYGDGSSASGVVYSDTVNVGGTTVTGQAVEQATKAASVFTSSSTPEDGLLGLAFDSINTVSPTPAKTFFTNAIAQGLPSAVFTADLKKGAAGSYTFGTIPTSQYVGSITYTTVDSSQGFWGFTPSAYAIGTGAAKTASLKGIADTGTTLLLLPDTVVNAYYAQVPSAQNDQGSIIFSCSATLPNLTFTINGYKAVVPGSFINFAANGDGTCFGGLQSSDGIGINIYGDIFLKSQFVVFDRTQSTPRLGFAAQ